MSANEALDFIRNYSVYELTDMADCGLPDTRESAGAAFLSSVRDDFVSAMEERDDQPWSEFLDSINDNGCLDEIADSAPNIYTHKLWSQFVDLQAYQEDPTEFGADGSDMEQSARICLYIIADRLVNFLLDEMRESADKEGED